MFLGQKSKLIELNTLIFGDLLRNVTKFPFHNGDAHFAYGISFIDSNRKRKLMNFS